MIKAFLWSIYYQLLCSENKLQIVDKINSDNILYNYLWVLHRLRLLLLWWHNVDTTWHATHVVHTNTGVAGLLLLHLRTTTSAALTARWPTWTHTWWPLGADHAGVVWHVGRWRHWCQLRSLARWGDHIGGLSVPAVANIGLGSVVLIGPVHGLCFNSGHDRVTFELPHLFSQISVGFLSIFIRIKGDIPRVIERALTRCNFRTVGPSKQVLKIKINE